MAALVDRFEHHLHLIWVVAEKYSEAWLTSEAGTLAQFIRDADDHDHPIAVHQLGGLIFADGFESGDLGAWTTSVGGSR